jgi:hypothetical protein
MARPLVGIKILSLARALVGPFTPMLLFDRGTGIFQKKDLCLLTKGNYFK